MLPIFSYSQGFLDIESGVIFIGYNDVRIPGNSGTLFSLKKDLLIKPAPYIRINMGYQIKERHYVGLLYAPLTIKATGRLDNELRFSNILVPPNTLINASYTFNSYRLTYRYNLIHKRHLKIGLGFSAKIRDAEIAVSANSEDVSTGGLGFVPLINFKAFWTPHTKYGLLLWGDGFAAAQGRALDMQLAGTFNINKSFSMRLGYRLLEGGSDGSSAYNFILLHYASFGLSYHLNNK